MKTLVLISKSVLFTVQVISWMPNMDILGPVKPPDTVLSAKGSGTYPSFSMLLKKLVRKAAAAHKLVSLAVSFHVLSGG